MLSAVRRLTFGLILIIAASAVLLVSDWNRRGRETGPETGTGRRVGVFQFASDFILD